MCSCLFAFSGRKSKHTVGEHLLWLTLEKCNAIISVKELMTVHFNAKWITTEDFKDKKPIDVFHKELVYDEIEESEIKNYHVHFRKCFELDAVKNTIVRISADDYYKLYINGEFVCQGPAAAYPEYYNYNELDVTPYLTPGKNSVAVHVYYQGEINRVWNSADNRQGMIMELISDSGTILATDKSWRYSVAKEFSGEKIGYDTQYLENIDFNLAEKGWTKTDFDDSNYINAVEKDDDDHEFTEEAEAVVDVYEVKPEVIKKLAPGEYFIDFGVEITGYIKLTAKGEKGQKVTVMCGEETEDTNPYAARYDMRCNCRYIEECTLSGGEDVFDFYDYKAFRYVNIKTDRDNLNPDSFVGVVRHRHFEEKCILKTDIPYLKEIWDICKNAVKIGAQGGYLDCPSREKGQYVGDFTITGLAHMYISGDYKMYKKALYDFARSKKVCKGLMAVAPGSLMQEFADYSLQYPLQILNYYNYTKDIGTVRELYPVVVGMLEYFKDYEREDGLLESVWEKRNLIDWPVNLRDGYVVENYGINAFIPVHNTINAYYIHAIDTAERLGELIGIERENKQERYIKSYIKAFYNEETKLFCDDEEKTHSALHSNVLAVFSGAAPCESYESIKKFIMEKGFCCGVYFSYFVLKALAKMGAYEDEMKLILNESDSSWINMIKEGASCCFEAWGKEKKWNTSLCHPWASSPVIAIIEDILKVDPASFACGEKTVVLEV